MHVDRLDDLLERYLAVRGSPTQHVMFKLKVDGRDARIVVAMDDACRLLDSQFAKLEELGLAERDPRCVDGG